jgi:hypothetical protein
MKRIHNGPPASDHFKNLLPEHGETCVKCSWCEREHIAIDSCNMIDDFSCHYAENTKTLRQWAKDDPDTYILHEGVDFVHFYQLRGMHFVIACPCNGLRPYENFMWEEREMWMKYLALRKLSLQDDLATLDGI